MGTLTKAGNTGTLGKNSQYRTPPVVVPPQVPSHYAPNYPMGHPRRQTSNTSTSSMGGGGGGGNERPGYSALPMPPSQQIVTQLNAPQIGMVHPMPPPPANSYDDRNSMPRKWGREKEEEKKCKQIILIDNQRSPEKTKQ